MDGLACPPSAFTFSTEAIVASCREQQYRAVVDAPDQKLIRLAKN